MIKHMNDFLAGLPMTILGGIFLVMSFVFPRAGIIVPLDPAWMTVISIAMIAAIATRRVMR